MKTLVCRGPESAGQGQKLKNVNKSGPLLTYICIKTRNKSVDYVGLVDILVLSHIHQRLPVALLLGRFMRSSSNLIKMLVLITLTLVFLWSY